MRKLALALGLTVVGGASALGTIRVMFETHDSLGAPDVICDSESASIALVAAGPIGTLIAGIRWIYYRWITL